VLGYISDPDIKISL